MEFTKKSRRALAFTMSATKAQFGALMTLTYPRIHPNDGKQVKLDFDAVRQRIRKRGFEYLWCLEFQKRGAPHFHVLLTANGISPYMRADWGIFWTQRIVTADWFTRLCPYEEYDRTVLKMLKFNLHARMFERLLSQEQAKAYMLKYIQKEAQKTVPQSYQNVGRFWGCSSGVRPEALQVIDTTYEEVKDWLTHHGHDAAMFDLMPSLLWDVTT